MTAYELRISDWSSDVCSSDLAYRAAERLHDDRLGRDHDLSNKAGVVHSEILAPEGAPERLNDRATLWNEVEAGEKRKHAQLAREVEFRSEDPPSELQSVMRHSSAVRYSAPTNKLYKLAYS